MKPNQNKIQKICFGALFAAIICVCTLISIPLPIGYFNLGDAAVLLSAWTLGPLYGVVAAAIGSARGMKKSDGFFITPRRALDIEYAHSAISALMSAVAGA